MSWARVDDQWWCHPKVVLLSPGACGLWAKALSWCSMRRTSEIPRRILPTLFPAVKRSELEAYARELSTPPEPGEAPLWEPTEKGWTFHDHAQYLTTPEERAKKAEAGRRGGQASGASRREAKSKQVLQQCEAEPKQVLRETEPPTEAPSKQNEATRAGSIPDPDPIPDPPVGPPPAFQAAGSASDPPKRRRTKTEVQPIPEDWFPPASVLADIAKTYHAADDDIRYQAEEFHAYWLSGGGSGERKANWLKAFRDRVHRIVQTGRRLSRPSGGQVGMPLRGSVPGPPTTEADPLEASDRLRRQREAERAKREIATPEQARAILAGATPEQVMGAAQ